MANIDGESTRMQQLIGRLLNLAQVEQRICSGLTALHGALYVLLSAEDYALLMGACLLLGLLDVFMMLTRTLDWYSIGKPREPEEVAS